MWNILELPGPVFALTAYPCPSLAIASGLAYHAGLRLLNVLTKTDAEIRAMGDPSVFDAFRTYRGHDLALSEGSVMMRLEAARHLKVSMAAHAPSGGASSPSRPGRAITDRQTGTQWPSVAALAAHLECSTHSVYRHLAKDPRYKTLRGSVYEWDVPHS